MSQLDNSHGLGWRWKSVSSATTWRSGAKTDDSRRSGMRTDHGSSLNRLWEQQMAELRAERDALQRVLFEGAQVQRKLMAPRQLRRGHFDIAGEIFAVRHVSGDFLATFDVGSKVVL